MLAEAVAVSVGGAAAAMTYAVRGPSSNLFGPSIYRGSPHRRSLALTFDDGPSEGTEDVLKVLDRFGVPATFFQCGANVLRLPSVSRAVKAAGHEIGNHSQTHAHLYLRDQGTIEREFARAQETIAGTIGAAPRYMRPPFGVRWFGFRKMQRELDLLGVMWTVIGLDWRLGSAQIVRRLLDRSANGGILCLHDGRELQPRPDLTQMLRALPEVIPVLQDRGFEFQTVSELLCPTN